MGLRSNLFFSLLFLFSLFARKKILSAIGILPITLARANVLKERKATIGKDEGLVKEFKR